MKIKRNADGSVERLKARVVAGGNFQVYEQDYMETYATVVSFTLVRVFLYITVLFQLHVVHVDVKTAFLNGILEEDIWITSPRIIPGRSSRCYKLLKAIYGLKQAHLAWHKRLCADPKTLGFEEMRNATCVFLKRTGDSKQNVFLIVYVDSILIISPTQKPCQKVVNALRELYDVHTTNSVDWFLGIPLHWAQENEFNTIRSLKLSQHLYIESILRRFQTENCEPVSTPMVESFWKGIADEKST